MPNHRGNIISNNISDRAFYNFKHWFHYGLW
jgi:hypothetical protein